MTRVRRRNVSDFAAPLGSIYALGTTEGDEGDMRRKQLPEDRCRFSPVTCRCGAEHGWVPSKELMQAFLKEARTSEEGSALLTRSAERRIAVKGTGSSSKAQGT